MKRYGVDDVLMDGWTVQYVKHISIGNGCMDWRKFLEFICCTLSHRVSFIVCFIVSSHILYSNSLVTFENSPFSSFVFQKIGFVSLNPWCVQPFSSM